MDQARGDYDYDHRTAFSDDIELLHDARSYLFNVSPKCCVWPCKVFFITRNIAQHKLSWGNGIFSLGTFFGIIAGGTAAGFLSNSLGQDRVWMCGFILIVLAIGGEFISRLMERKPPANPSKKIEWNFVKELRINLKSVSKNRVLSLAIVGSVYFWLIGALYEPTLVVFGKMFWTILK